MAVVEEALTHYQQLHQGVLDASLPERAGTLIRLSVLLSNAGQQQRR